MSNYESCVLYIPELKKKGLKLRSAPVSVYTFKVSKIIIVDRNKEFNCIL